MAQNLLRFVTYKISSYHHIHIIEHVSNAEGTGADTAKKQKHKTRGSALGT